jgi:cysteine synthase A
VDVRDGFTDTVGNTPLIKLRKASELTGCTILGKAEFLNPGGSVKDRAAKYIVLDAEERGDLRPGGVIVEGTAGNTGIGLALVGNARGYRTVIVIPDTQSQEKKDMLRLCGAELREVPAVPYKDPNNYVHIAERLAKELGEREPNGVLYANQWDNLSNREGHVRSTGPEIWEQTDGTVDGFTCAIGTGGTLAGVASFLKERNPEIRTAAADPLGAAMYNWIVHGEVKGSEGSSITEGIGQGRVTGNVDGAPIDDAYAIPDEEMLPIVFDLLSEEGLCLGGSSGINVAGASSTRSSCAARACRPPPGSELEPPVAHALRTGCRSGSRGWAHSPARSPRRDDRMANARYSGRPERRGTHRGRLGSPGNQGKGSAPDAACPRQGHSPGRRGVCGGRRKSLRSREGPRGRAPSRGRQRPLKTGLRFSRKARGPSAASSELITFMPWAISRAKASDSGRVAVSRIVARMARTASGPFCAMRSAILRASASAWPSGTTRPTSPSSAARRAEMGSPVTSISTATV